MVGGKNRYLSKKKALRKRKIDRQISYDGSHEMYDNLHQYSKNKIHCSCAHCSAKTRNKGKKRITKRYAPSINYKPSDLRKQQAMDYQEVDE